MRIRTFTTLFMVSLLSVSALPVVAQEAAKTPKTLTIYTNGLALIDEVRDLKPGVSTSVYLNGVSPMMIPDSVQIGLSDGINVREVAFDSDVLTYQALLKRSVGKTVKFARVNPASGEETIEDAKILSIVGGLILEIDGRIETNLPGRIIFDSVPDDLHSTPTLSLNLSEPILKPNRATLAYLTNGMSWDGVYTMVLNQAHTSAALDGWARINNRTGLDFEDVRISLVAGDVQRATAPHPAKMLMRAEGAMMASAAMDAGNPAPQELSAFHIYDIAGTSTLRDKESRQLRLLSGKEIAISGALEFRNGAAVYGPVRGRNDGQSALQKIRFTNTDQNGLGDPIPSGLVRAYMRDDAGKLRFIGEDRVGNTPNGEELTLNLGRAFDVTMARLQSDFERIDKRSSEAAFKLTIKNGGKKTAMVEVIEDIPGDWKMLSSSEPHTRDGISAKWRINVAAGSSVELSYRVFVRR